jgi:hypothetical protein
MAATQKKNIWFWGTTLSTPPPLRTYTMTASEGILMPGTPVQLAAGYLELSDTDDTTVLGFLAGLVDKTATWPLAATTAAVEFYVAIPRYNDVWGVYCTSTATDTAVTQAAVGIRYAITVGASSGFVGYATCNIAKEDADFFNVVDIASNVEPARYTTSDNPGVVLAKIVATLEG